VRTKNNKIYTLALALAAVAVLAFNSRLVSLGWAQTAGAQPPGTNTAKALTAVQATSQLPNLAHKTVQADETLKAFVGPSSPAERRVP
jgi:hypothetical protein